MYWRPQTIVSKDLLLNYLCMPAQHASAYPKCIGNYLFEYLGPKPGDSMHWTIKNEYSIAGPKQHISKRKNYMHATACAKSNIKGKGKNVC